MPPSYRDEEPEAVSRARLAAIVESSDDVIVSKTLDGIITSWNRAAEHLFGWTATEAIGRHIMLIVPEERRAEEDDVLARIRRGDRVDHFETVRRALHGAERPVEHGHERDVLGARGGSHGLERGLDGRVEVHAVEIQPQAACRDPCEIEEVLDEASLGRGVAQDGVDGSRAGRLIQLAAL